MDVLSKMGRVFSVYKTHLIPQVVTREKLSTSRKPSDTTRDDLLLNFVNELFALYRKQCIMQFRRSHTEYGSTEVLDMLQDEDLSSDIVESEYFVFMHVMKHFVSQVKSVDRSIPMCGLAENATGIVEGCVQFQIKSVFRKVHGDTGTLFVTFYKDVYDLGRNSRDGEKSVLPKRAP
ncbi:unnamed protein product [Peronospora farinosa]|uniref:Uncharacterized protein n=1 Tax=Peronospora farinosa TaxID=134698 RepID=A0AAV0SQN0_9STRA|nr:unnamed protein product [Peronospora farinosa]CAI5704691.1 unnamed protein product [Peronospora farinosa]